jgi:16S rRNA (guanine527-N7)-methyltransferase
LDIGTGAGFPGLVLKIVFPNLKIDLLDSTNKKCMFLEQVINKLQLKDIKVINARAEEYAKESGTTKEELIKQYTANYIECIYVEEQAVKTLVQKVLANSETK